MSHYWDHVEPTPEELERARASGVAARLRALPASRFTVEELALLLRCGWSPHQDGYYKDQRRILDALADREGVAKESR